MIITDHNYISVTQAAEIGRVTPQGIRKAIAEDRLDALKIGAGYVLERQRVERYFGKG